MTTSQLIIGLQNGANNNQAIVTGTNSLVTASANFSVGELRSGNSLLISKGGQVTNFLVGYAGRQGRTIESPSLTRARYGSMAPRSSSVPIWGTTPWKSPMGPPWPALAAFYVLASAASQTEIPEG